MTRDLGEGVNENDITQEESGVDLKEFITNERAKATGVANYSEKVRKRFRIRFFFKHLLTIFS